MKTEADANRVAELYVERRDLQRSAAVIRESEHPCIGVATDPDPAEITEYATIRVLHFTPDLMALLGREIDAQMAAIDNELVEMGFDPSEPGKG